MKAVSNDTAGSGYCGPTVVAGITGKPLSKVLDAFRTVKFGKWWPGSFDRAPNIRGTTRSEVIRTLQMFGYVATRPKEGGDTTYYRKAERMTMARWYKKREDYMRRFWCLIETHGHWVLVKGNRFMDTHTDQAPVTIGKAPLRRARVHAVTAFYKSGKMVAIPTKKKRGKIRRRAS